MNKSIKLHLQFDLALRTLSTTFNPSHLLFDTDDGCSATQRRLHLRVHAPRAPLHYLRLSLLHPVRLLGRIPVLDHGGPAKQSTQGSKLEEARQRNRGFRNRQTSLGSP